MGRRYRCDPGRRCTGGRGRSHVVGQPRFGCGARACRRAAGGTTVDGPPPTLTAEGFPEGLSFLTPQVEPTVRAQIEQCMATGTPFHGVVAGTVLVIDAQRTEPHDGRFVTNCGVTIGVPLVQPSSTGV